LHAAVELAGIAQTGEIAPYVSGLSEEQRLLLETVASELKKLDLDFRGEVNSERVSKIVGV